MRSPTVLVVAVLAVVAAPTAAAAHTGFEPATAAPGSIVTLTLNVEHERSGVGFGRVELFMPDTATVPVVDTPAVAGWSATTRPATADTPASVIWTGGPATDDLALPLTIGPLPESPGRLQFKALQTYDDGEVARWIAEWPAGAAEPENPGPVLDLVPGAAGTIPETTTTAPTTTTVATSSTTLPGEPAGETDTDGEDDGAPVVLIALAVAVAGVAGAGAYAMWRRRARPPRT